MKTKLLALFLVAVMMLSMLVACGEKENPDTPDDDKPGGDIVDPPKPGGDGGDGTDVPPTPGGDDDKDEVPPEFDWEETPLIFQMTDNSNHEELSSGCRRYLAGEDTESYENIDDMIAERNAAAYEATKVSITYDYLPDTNNYAWGQNIEDIFTKVNSQAKDRPDMFCNFVYDMVSTSLKGSFANLYSTSRGEGVLNGANYFEFTDPKFEDTGAGYMFEYMKSLTLSKHKMYCLSSDYFTDMVRAFFAVPVNIKLMNSIEMSPEAGKFNSDRTGDGKFNIDDFYQLVWDNEWNYDTLAEFSGAIYQDDGVSDMANLDDRIGFAISSSSGLSSSGMLYTTSVVVIHRDWNEDRNDYSYYYPATNPDLYRYCDNLKALFEKTGIISVSNSEAGIHGADSLQAIRNRFAQDMVLFGGVICVGSLEYEEYQGMNQSKDGGFGVVPVPLYRTDDGQGNVDKYLTQIHNIGRIGGISASTTKFAQCSAFLNYQSTHSTDILNEYYEYKLQYDISGGSQGNIDMLQYIRYNVRSSFDKAFEDAIGIFFTTVDPDSSKHKWHSMIQSAGFKMTDMETKYTELFKTKEKYLASLVNEYDVLPD